ncbi:MAG: Asp-tRNA(Asn)/Glu-tRNA(Gln) amidotransferase subunit GatB [Pirellulales bacterium]
MSSPYTTIIGLEVHVQLATASKLFCGCSTRFGAPPNAQTCPVCIGLPGALPVMNRKAFQLALKTAVALNCEIPEFTKWDRKQYYYPDLPKGYQISQYDLPMSQHGYFEIADPQGGHEPKRVRILRAHLEEDAGKSIHDEVAGKGDSLIDLNRTGTPLLEIVSEPDLRSSLEAKAFLTELRLLLTYIGVSDCNMQEGSLRVDANVNLHLATPQGKVATPIVEIKNMNSFRAVERALDYEAERQYRVWQETGQRLGDVPKQTRGWDDTAGVTRAQRSKEESSDYRYFPDPDLVPVITTVADVDAVRASLEEAPAALRLRIETAFGVSAYDANVIVNQGRELADYYLAVAKGCGDGKAAANWVTQDVMRVLKEREWTLDQLVDTRGITPEWIADLVKRATTSALTRGQARQVFDAKVREVSVAIHDTIEFTVDAIVAKLGIQQVDESELVSLCQELLAANPRTIADVRAGKLQAVGALIGQAKKKNPNADPNRVREICLDLIQSGSV